MAENPDEPWFYSQGGQQFGPVPFSELQAKVNGGELDPFKDLVWKNGMANWTPVGQMRDTFKVAGEPEPSPTPTPAPAPQPEPEPAAKSLPAIEPKPAAAPAPAPAPEPKPQPKPEPKPAHKQGIQQAAPQVAEKEKPKEKKKPEAEAEGANRMHYFLGVYVFPIVWTVILMLVVAALGSGGTSAILSLVGFLILLIVVFVVILKRFTNLAMSRWWILGMFVPLLNLWVGYRLFACPSGYGAGRKMDGIGIMLAILYWLSLIAPLAIAPLIMVMAVTNAIENPELMNDPQKRAELNKALIELRDMIKEM